MIKKEHLGSCRCINFSM